MKCGMLAMVTSDAECLCDPVVGFVSLAICSSVLEPAVSKVESILKFN